PLDHHSVPTRRSSDLPQVQKRTFHIHPPDHKSFRGTDQGNIRNTGSRSDAGNVQPDQLSDERQKPKKMNEPKFYTAADFDMENRSEEHTSELQSRENL